MASELPRAFLFSGHNEFFGIKVSIFIAIGSIFILYFLLNHTQLGTKIYAIGGNQSTASKLGINVSNITIIVFTISGFLAGISGMLFAGYMNAVTPDIADGYVFLSFAGAILGGISMFGGRGTMGGAAGGALLIILIDVGLQLLNIDPYIRLTLRGVFILIAILIDKSRISLINKILLPNK
jgi:ribose/xylose/arabinose/galactoside ABC-type transport system permease subunit